MSARAAAVLIVALFSGCTQQMGEEGHLRTFAQSAFYGNKPLVMTPPLHSVARGQLALDSRFAEGMEPGGNGITPVRDIPVPITGKLLARGRERFEIYCVACHGYTGEGNGIVVQRGFLSPPSYHTDELRSSPAGHFFDVITNGRNAMYGYGDRVSVADRWAIVAYIRALQLSRNAGVRDLDARDRKALEEQ